MTVLVPSGLSSDAYLDQANGPDGSWETSQLKSFADGLRQGVTKTKSNPNQTGWDQMIATSLGLEISQVRTNERGQARVFLIDPAFQIDANVGLSSNYVQNAYGVTNQPVNPRLLIVSVWPKCCRPTSSAELAPRRPP
jgi:hypothetical protein